jgi:hypothetical protein
MNTSIKESHVKVMQDSTAHREKINGYISELRKDVEGELLQSKWVCDKMLVKTAEM